MLLPSWLLIKQLLQSIKGMLGTSRSLFQPVFPQDFCLRLSSPMLLTWQMSWQQILMLEMNLMMDSLQSQHSWKHLSHTSLTTQEAASPGWWQWCQWSWDGFSDKFWQLDNLGISWTVRHTVMASKEALKEFKDKTSGRRAQTGGFEWALWNNPVAYQHLFLWYFAGIVLLIPQSTSDGHHFWTLTHAMTFEEVLEIMYDVIGCTDVHQKPNLSYKLVSAPLKADPITLGSAEDSPVANTVLKNKHLLDTRLYANWGLH